LERPVTPAPPEMREPEAAPRTFIAQQAVERQSESDPSAPSWASITESAKQVPPSAPVPVEAQTAPHSSGSIPRMPLEVAGQVDTELLPLNPVRPLPETEEREHEEPSPGMDDVLPDAPPEAPRLPLQAVPLEAALFGIAGPTQKPPAQPEYIPVRNARDTADWAAPATPVPTTVTRRLSLEESQLAIAPMREDGPVMHIQLVRRAAEQEATPAPASQAPPRADQSPAQAAGPDLDRLAEEVYRRLRERLRVERERQGRF
jgi:hypothetical protein